MFSRILFRFARLKVAVLLSLVSLVSLAMALGNAFAAPPQTLDYQGYLADSSGVPLTGSQNLSISLYTAASGGSALWTQASAPNLSNGRFTVVLDGSGANSFPVGLFDQQLYVGLTVDSDPEMTPRQPLTSVPSAFEAINSDTVDGMEANEIIDAASDEVRTPISSLPFTINQSGSYYFTQDLTATAANGQNGLIDVNADDVTIDLMGFTLDGNGVDDYGIDLGSNSAGVIKNGTVRGSGRTGIYGILGTLTKVLDMHVIANGGGLTGQEYSGIYLGHRSHVEGVIARANGGWGILVGVNSMVKDSAAFNSVSTGISGGNGSILENNRARGNQGSGIILNLYGVVRNSVARENQGPYGIFVGQGTVAEGNLVEDNARWGILASGDNKVISNVILRNNSSSQDARGGLSVNADSLVKNNMVDGNRHSGIYIAGSDNLIKDNHVTDSININGGGNADGYCFEFASSDNAAIANTATGCTTGFGGSLPPSSRSDDNIAW